MSDPDKQRHLRNAILAGMLLAAVLLAGCTGTAERLWLKAPSWSRAVWVGSSVDGSSAPLALDGSGTLYFLFIQATEDGRAVPRLKAMNRQAQTLWERSYEELNLTRASRPRLAWDGSGLHLFWIENEQLFHAGVEPHSGLLRDWPATISGAQRADTYDVAVDAGGRLHVWFAGPRRAPGLFILPPGDLAATPQQVDAEGVRPDVVMDAAGVLHAIWAQYPAGLGTNRVFYAAYPGGEFQSGRQSEIAQPLASPTSILQGPMLGLDHERVHVFWTIEVRTGLAAGAVDSGYITFPHGQPAGATPRQPLSVPGAYQLAYQAVDGGDLAAGERVLLEAYTGGTTAQISDLYPDQGVHQEMAVAQRAVVDFVLRSSEAQVGVQYLRGGQAHSYQLLSFTAGDSRAPFLLTDADGDLYLTWLERGDAPGFVVYFASTATDLRRALQTLTSGDVSRLAASTLFGLLTGALLIPFALIWFIAPLVVVAVGSFLRGEDDSLRNWRVVANLGLALFSYWASKLLFLPGMRSYVPFSAWIPFIPPWMALPLRFGAPAAITVLALWLAWRFTYRVQRTSPLLFTLVFLAVDSLLTTAIYGVIIFAAE